MMKYRLTEKQRQEYLQLREQLDTQERERLVKELEEAGADASGFSMAALQARGALQQLENRIRKMDLVLDNCQIMREEDPADALACNLARIRVGENTDNFVLAETGDARICLQQRKENGTNTIQLTLDRKENGKKYLCLARDEEGGRQVFLVLGEPFWQCGDPQKEAAASYRSIAQAAGSAYLPYLLILYYLDQDRLHADQMGIPDENYYLDEDLCSFLTECPPWMPLPGDKSNVRTDGPVKKPMRSAQIPIEEDGVILRLEYGERFGFAYQILPAGKQEEEEYDPFAEEKILEEYYHLRDLLQSRYLRYYLMLAGTIEIAGTEFTEL